MNPSEILPPPRTPPPQQPARSQQPVGAHFATPQKKRAPRKDSALVIRSDALLRRQKLELQLETLLESSEEDEAPTAAGPFVDTATASEGDEAMDIDERPNMSMEPAILDSQPEPLSDAHSAKRARRLGPDEPSQRLYSNWLALVPSLIRDFLHYIRCSHGRTGWKTPQFVRICQAGCMPDVAMLQCLYYDRECSCSRHLSVITEVT